MGDPGAGVPVGVDHQVGHGGRRQDRVVASGRELDPAGTPAQTGRERRLHGQGVDVGEVAGGATDPGALAEVGGLAGAAVVPGRLGMAQSQTSAGADIRRGHLVVDEPVEDPTAGSGAPERLAEGGGERVVDVDVGLRRGFVPVGGRITGQQVVDVLGR